jgi:hypothetical protein
VLKRVYPDQQWKEMRSTKAKGYWNDLANQKAFLERVAAELKIQKPEDWYFVKLETLYKMGGSFILYHYKGSLLRGMKYEIVSDLLSHYCSRLMHQAATIVQKKIQYNLYDKPCCLICLTLKALSAIYPEHQWKSATTNRVKGYWNNRDNIRSFFDTLASKLNITQPEEWYFIRADTVEKMGGSFLRKYSGSLIRGTKK